MIGRYPDGEPLLLAQIATAEQAARALENMLSAPLVEPDGEGDLPGQNKPLASAPTPTSAAVGNPTKSGTGGTKESTSGASDIIGHALADTHGFEFQTRDGSVNINRDARPANLPSDS
jgi:hypothetical protein